MKLGVRDVISMEGRDFIVQAVLSYKVGGKVYPLARAADGKDVRWIEPLLDDSDDRLLVFKEIKDLDIATPPPPTISYKGGSYVPRLSGAAAVTMSGTAPDRAPGSCEMWRYRAGGDVFLQIEKWADKTVCLAGESVAKGMVDVLPGSP